MDNFSNINAGRKTSRRKLGDHGEDIACQWYKDRGYKIVDRNVSISGVGEIDVIAMRANMGKAEFVFSEVKTRTGSRSGYGYESVDKHKRIRMGKSAMSWIDNNIDRSSIRTSWRLDVISIDVSKQPPAISVFENIEI